MNCLENKPPLSVHYVLAIYILYCMSTAAALTQHCPQCLLKYCIPEIIVPYANYSESLSEHDSRIFFK